MRCIGKVSRRPPAARGGDRNGGFSRLSDVVARVFRYTVSLRHALLTEILEKPSL